MAHHRPRALELAELGEDEGEARLHLLVRVENDPPGRVMNEASGQRQAQLASPRLLTLALMQAHPDLVQLGLAHDARQAE